MQLEPFRRRLENSIHYIDMHVEMCQADAQQADMARNVTELEQRFYQLLSDVDVRVGSDSCEGGPGLCMGASGHCARSRSQRAAGAAPLSHSISTASRRPTRRIRRRCSNSGSAPSMSRATSPSWLACSRSGLRHCRAGPHKRPRRQGSCTGASVREADVARGGGGGGCVWRAVLE